MDSVLDGRTVSRRVGFAPTERAGGRSEIWQTGATTLIVSLRGILSTRRDLIIIEVAVFLLIVQAWVIHRLAGIRYPLWNAARDDEA